MTSSKKTQFRVRNSMRRRIVMGMSICFVFVMVYSVLWQVAEWFLKESFEMWITSERAVGTMVESSDLLVTGYPLQIHTALSSLNLQRTNRFLWTGTGLSATFSILHPTRVNFLLSDPHTLKLFLHQDLLMGIEFVRGDGEFLVDLWDRVFEGRIDMREVQIAALSRQLETQKMVDIKVLDFTVIQPFRETHSEVVFEVQAQDVGSDVFLESFFPIDVFYTFLRVQNGERHVFTGGGFSEWIVGGGGVQIDKLEVVSKIFEIEATGRISFDDSLQPIGEIKLRVKGIEKFLARFFPHQRRLHELVTDFGPFLKDQSGFFPFSVIIKDQEVKIYLSWLPVPVHIIRLPYF